MIFIIIKNVRSHQFLPILYTDSVLQEGGWLLMKPIVAGYTDDRIVRSRISTSVTLATKHFFIELNL